MGGEMEKWREKVESYRSLEEETDGSRRTMVSGEGSNGVDESEKRRKVK